MIDRIEQIIIDENLKEKTKYRYIVHKRWYLFILLRKHKIKYKRIGEMFNLNHSTIIYGISMGNFYENKMDELYLLDTLKLKNEFEGKEIIFEQRNLINDICNCKSMQELLLIKARLKNNQYLNYKN
jgi:hypothetical protein